MPLPVHPVARGASLIVAGMAVIGFIDNFVWVIAAEISVWQFHLFRSAIALPLLALAAAFGLRLRPNRPLRVAARAVLHGAAMLSTSPPSASCPSPRSAPASSPRRSSSCSSPPSSSASASAPASSPRWPRASPASCSCSAPTPPASAPTR